MIRLLRALVAPLALTLALAGCASTSPGPVRRPAAAGETSSRGTAEIAELNARDAALRGRIEALQEERRAVLHLITALEEERRSPGPRAAEAVAKARQRCATANSD